jgi:hypothetical protein
LLRHTQPFWSEPPKYIPSSLRKDYSLFGGRTPLIEDIQRFLADPTKGYLFVTGPSGYGKTALLVHWAGQTGIELGAGYFINRAHGKANDEEAFAKTLCQQLLAWHDLPGGLPPNLLQLRELYAHLLRLPPGDSQKVVLIDGLDEASGWSSFRDYIPSDLPTGVKIIFSARAGEGHNWLYRLKLASSSGRPDERTDVLRLDALTVDDLAGLLREAGSKAGVLADHRKLLQDLLSVSQGDPFYARLLVEDLRDGHLEPETVGKKPVGLQAYLDGWWGELSSPGIGKDAQDFLGTAVARGPLRIYILAQMFPRLGPNMMNVLAQVWRFVIGDERGATRYATHASLNTCSRRRI